MVVFVQLCGKCCADTLEHAACFWQFSSSPMSYMAEKTMREIVAGYDVPSGPILEHFTQM